MCVCVCADAYYNNVRAELDSMAQDFEVESWSLAVDQHFLKKHSKEVIKRQDVIYGVCVCVSYTLFRISPTHPTCHKSVILFHQDVMSCLLNPLFVIVSLY